MREGLSCGWIKEGCEEEGACEVRWGQALLEKGHSITKGKKDVSQRHIQRKPTQGET